MAIPQRAADLANAIADQLIAASDTVYGTNGQVQDFIAGQIEATQVQIEETQAEIDRLTGLPSRTLEQDQQLAALKGQVASLRQCYAALVELSRVRRQRHHGRGSRHTADAPSSPRVLLNTLIAALVGLLLALGIAFTLEYLDDTVKSSSDVEEATGLPTLGTIVKMKAEKGRSEIYRLATVLYPRGPAAEAYRTLRTNLEFASVDEPSGRCSSRAPSPARARRRPPATSPSPSPRPTGG